MSLSGKTRLELYAVARQHDMIGWRPLRDFKQKNYIFLIRFILLHTWLLKVSLAALLLKFGDPCCSAIKKASL